MNRAKNKELKSQESGVSPVRSDASNGVRSQESEQRQKRVCNLFSVVCVLCSVLFALYSCSPAKEKLYKESRLAMYTTVSITVSSNSKERARSAIDAAFKELDRLEGLLNYYAKDSEVSLINRNAGVKPVNVSKETLEIIEKALYVSKKTDGGFDITMGPVIALWDFHNKIIPEEGAIKEALKLVGYENVIVNREKSTVFIRKKGAEINLGGIIKGYAADKAVEILKGNGIKAGIVAVAGDIKTFGIRPDGELWNVGIRNPRPNKLHGDKEIIATLNFSDLAISTSGDYHRFFVHDGKMYHHLLNPKTGYPAYGSQSVTVITEVGAFADGFTTGIFILGPQRGMEALKKLGFDGVIIDKDGNILVTEGIKDKIHLKER